MGAMILASSAAAAADMGSTYVSGAVGVAKTDDIDANSNTFLAPIDAETGRAGLVAIGRHFGEMIRGEIELAHTKHDADQVGGAQASGDIESLTVGGNLLFDFHLSGAITPYVGLGVGMVRVSLDDVTPVGGSTLDDGATGRRCPICKVSRVLPTRSTSVSRYSAIYGIAARNGLILRHERALRSRRT
ncbi:MAG: outer membrane beta-barrel protein [Alphaproteobacteria bacterium]